LFQGHNSLLFSIFKKNYYLSDNKEKTITPKAIKYRIGQMAIERDEGRRNAMQRPSFRHGPLVAQPAGKKQASGPGVDLHPSIINNYILTVTN